MNDDPDQRSCLPTAPTERAFPSQGVGVYVPPGKLREKSPATKYVVANGPARGVTFGWASPTQIISP